MFKGANILITGGTGSWGNELTQQLLQLGARKITIFSRGELAQVTMQRSFDDSRLDFLIGDVRDLDAMMYACRGIDYIFHLAALKHVPVCERLPQEAVKTNINGTINVIKSAIANNIKKVIDVSTDKAVDPLNLYGMTKAVGERLVIQANELSDTKFVCIRGGNVIGSNGSVIPYFIQQIKLHNEILLTDAEMTRYFMTLPQAISLLFKAAEVALGGETFVMRMDSFRLFDIAQCLIEHHGNADTTLKEIGIRPGEKIHEVLISKNEARLAYHFDENYYLILPVIDPNSIAKSYKNVLSRLDLPEYSSQTFISDKEAARLALAQGGFV